MKPHYMQNMIMESATVLGLALRSLCGIASLQKVVISEITGFITSAKIVNLHDSCHIQSDVYYSILSF